MPPEMYSASTLFAVAHSGIELTTLFSAGSDDSKDILTSPLLLMPSRSRGRTRAVTHHQTHAHASSKRAPIDNVAPFPRHGSGLYHRANRQRTQMLLLCQDRGSCPCGAVTVAAAPEIGRASCRERV